MKRTFSIMVMSALVWLAAPSAAPGSTITSDAIVLQWNEIAVETIGATPPFPSARFMATVQVAVFEAVNAITGDYEPYLGTITAPPGASPEAAAVTAAHGVLKAFFGGQGATLDRRRDDSLATIPDGQAKDDGIDVGLDAAAAMITNRTDDGSAPAEFWTPPNTEPYEWQTTASCPPAGGVFLHWRNVNPFGIESSSQFRADPPPALTSKRYARDYNELQTVGYVGSPERPQDRADVARLYAALAPHRGWNSVLRQIANPRHDDISHRSRSLRGALPLSTSRSRPSRSRFCLRQQARGSCSSSIAPSGNSPLRRSLATPDRRRLCERA